MLCWDPVELEGPEWLDGEKARDDPEAGQERELKLEIFSGIKIKSNFIQRCK